MMLHSLDGHVRQVRRHLHGQSGRVVQVKGSAAECRGVAGNDFASVASWACCLAVLVPGACLLCSQRDGRLAWSSGLSQLSSCSQRTSLAFRCASAYCCWVLFVNSVNTGVGEIVTVPLHTPADRASVPPHHSSCQPLHDRSPLRPLTEVWLCSPELLALQLSIVSIAERLYA